MLSRWLNWQGRRSFNSPMIGGQVVHHKLIPSVIADNEICAFEKLSGSFCPWRLKRLLITLKCSIQLMRTWDLPRVRQTGRCSCIAASIVIHCNFSDVGDRNLWREVRSAYAYLSKCHKTISATAITRLFSTPFKKPERHNVESHLKMFRKV